MSRSQIYQWRSALREGRLSELGSEVVGFVPVEMPTAPSGRPPVMDNFTGVSTIEIGLACGRSLKVLAWKIHKGRALRGGRDISR